MRPSTTTLLLLGAVALYEPVNGYQIRRELLTWQVDRWGNVKPGSIYHALSRLADAGDLIRHNLPDGSRDVAVYEITSTGREHLMSMIERAIIDVEVFDRRAFQAAFGLLPLVGDVRALDLLDQRLATMNDPGGQTHLGSEVYPYAPPHALRGAQMWVALMQAEREWLTGVVTDMRSGKFSFTDHTSWSPPADDPGHEMISDRERYRALIAARSGTSE